MTQLQVDALRDQVVPFAREIAKWHHASPDDILSICWLFFFHCTFTLAERGPNGQPEL